MTCLANNLTPTNINITKEMMKNMKFPDNASCLHWKRKRHSLLMQNRVKESSYKLKGLRKKASIMTSIENAKRSDQLAI